MYALLPEISAELVLTPDYICDLDTQGLSIFSNRSFDFVILSHVIEHVANPIHVISEVFRVVKYDGPVVIACPA